MRGADVSADPAFEQACLMVVMRIGREPEYPSPSKVAGRAAVQEARRQWSIAFHRLQPDIAEATKVWLHLHEYRAWQMWQDVKRATDDASLSSVPDHTPV